MNLDDKHGENCFKETVIAAIPSTAPDSPLNSHCCINANNAFHLSPSFRGFAVLNCTMATETKKEVKRIRRPNIFTPHFSHTTFVQVLLSTSEIRFQDLEALKLEKKVKSRA